MYANKRMEQFILNAKKQKAEKEKKKAVSTQKTDSKKATLQEPFTNEALINQQKAKYDAAAANNDFIGKRIANTQANKIREATNTPLYSSAVGDKQAAKTFAKTATSAKQNIAIQMAQNVENQQQNTVLGQMFDKQENYVDKAKKGNIKGAALNVLGSSIQAPQSTLFNTFNNIDSVVSGNGLAPIRHNMDYTDYENAVANRHNDKTITQKLSELNPTLGSAYNIGMNIITDPLTLLDGAAILKVKGLKTLGSAHYADDLLKGGKTFTPTVTKTSTPVLMPNGKIKNVKTALPTNNTSGYLGQVGDTFEVNRPLSAVSGRNIRNLTDQQSYINDIVEELGARHNPRNLTTANMRIRDNEIAKELGQIANMTELEFKEYAKQHNITKGQLPTLHNAKKEVKPIPINQNVPGAAQESKNILNQKTSKQLDSDRLRERLNFPKKNTTQLNVGTPVVNLERGNRGTIAKDMGNGEYLVLFENKSTGNKALVKMNDKQFAATEQIINDLDYTKALNKTNEQIKSPSRSTEAFGAENKAIGQTLPTDGTSIQKSNGTPLETNLRGRENAEIPTTRKDKNFEEKYNSFINDEAYGTPTGNTGIGDWIANIKSKGVGISKDITRNAETALDGEGLAWFNKNFADNFYKSKGQNATNIKDKTDYLYREVVKNRGIRKGTKESAGVQWFGEGQKMVGSEAKPYTLADLKEDFGYKMANGKYAWQNITESDGIMRGMYDDYVGKINESLTKIYPNAEQEVAKMQARKAGKSLDEIQQIDRDIDRYITGKRLYPRKDYYHHFQELQNGFFSSLDNVLNSATNIDPKLVGLSENTKPKSKFMGALQHRSKDSAYKADALGGMLEYIPQAEYKVNIEPNIPVLRDMIKDLKEYTGGNANQFIDHLMKFTNDLAGKTNDLDRIPLKLLGDENGRKALNALSTVSNRVRANAVVGNVNTVLAQFFNMPNVVGYAKNPLDVAQGMFDASKAVLGDKNAQAVLDKSNFLRERYLDRSMRQFNTGIMGNTENFLSWTMELGDKAVADSAFMTFYKQGIKKGMPDAQAVRFADDLTRKSVAGRGIGELPLAQKAKVTKLIAPFQVEVQNAYNVLKELGSQKQVAPILGIFATTWLMNNALEELSGRRIGFDPVDVLKDAYENKEDKSLADNAKDTGARMFGEALSNAPFGSYIGEAATNYLGMGEYNKQQLFGESDPTRFGTGNMAIQTLGAPIGQAVRGENIDLLKPAMAVLPKFGGKQIERSIRGLQDMAVLPKEKINADGASLKKQDFPASYSSGGRLRFALEPTTENLIKAPTLGVWATSEGKEYVNNKSKSLGDKQTQFVEEANKKGLPATKGEEIIRSFKGVKADEQRESVLSSSMTTKQKQIVGDYIDSGLKEPRDYSSQENYDFSLLSKETRQKYLFAKNASKEEFTKAYLAQKEFDSSVDKAYAILEHSNAETAKALGISVTAIESAKQMKAVGISDFNSYKQAADTDGNNSVKKDEAINMLETTDLTKEQKRALFKALCPNVKKVPY